VWYSYVLFGSSSSYHIFRCFKQDMRHSCSRDVDKTAANLFSRRRLILRLWVVFLIALLGQPLNCCAFSPPFMNKGKAPTFKPMFENLSDPLSAEISPDAEQLAELLGIDDKLKKIIELNASDALSGEQRQQLSDLRFDVLESVEETRLQIDFVQAEIDEEESILEEAGRVFRDHRDDRVNRANQLAFRTNGVLWTVAEALSIPTFKYTRLSVPSGSVGIIAGIVPSVFSEYAVLAGSGERYARQSYPNILTGIYDLPIIPRITFPDIVWQYLKAKPFGQPLSRKEVMRERWLNNKNIKVFKKGISKEKILLLTGNEPYTADLELISDKLIMLGQVKVVVLQMSRPLLEICMVARGKKKYPLVSPLVSPVTAPASSTPVNPAMPALH
jgi:hypothetical protein